MRRLVVALAVICAALALRIYTRSPTSPPRMTEVEVAQIKAEVDSVTRAWWDAWRVFDWDRGISFIEDAPETTWTGAGPTLYSVAEMREAWPSANAGFGRQDLEFTNARTVVLAPDIVWTLREGDYVLRDTAGVEVARGRFNETAVWVKRDGEWRVLLGHDDDTTPPGTPGEDG